MTRTGDREIVVVSGILPDNSGELACMKFTHFRLYIENKQLRLLIVLGLPHILTVIYVFNKRFY